MEITRNGGVVANIDWPTSGVTACLGFSYLRSRTEIR
jgi:hypothetical protein